MKLASLPKPWQATVAEACRGCDMRTRCFLASPLPDEDGACTEVVQRRFPIARGDKLYRRNAPLNSLYQVCSGSLKTQRETREGGLVVTGFFLPGDVVGIEAIADRHYPSDAIATTDTEVCQLDFEHLLTHCGSNPALHDWVITRIGFYVRRKDTELSWSTGLHTHQRVLRFFIELYDRLRGDSDVPPTSRALPMRKQDIARYLHMTPETLSRNLAHLRRTGLLHLHNDRFVLPDAERAREMTRL